MENSLICCRIVCWIRLVHEALMFHHRGNEMCLIEPSCIISVICCVFFISLVAFIKISANIYLLRLLPLYVQYYSSAIFFPPVFLVTQSKLCVTCSDYYALAVARLTGFEQMVCASGSCRLFNLHSRFLADSLINSDLQKNYYKQELSYYQCSIRWTISVGSG